MFLFYICFILYLVTILILVTENPQNCYSSYHNLRFLDGQVLTSSSVNLGKNIKYPANRKLG